MPAEHWAFVAAAAVLIMVPGADMALVARNTVGFGRRDGLITSAGILVGVTIHAAAAAIGLSAVIAASSQLFAGLRTAGVVYLVWLGVQTWRQASAGNQAAGIHNAEPLPAPPSARSTSPFLRPFSQGLITNVLNPKLVVFFMTFVPQFVEPGAPPMPQIIVLSVVFVLLSIVWLLFYVAVLGRFADVLALPTVKRRLDRVAAAVLVGLGLRLAFERG